MSFVAVAEVAELRDLPLAVQVPDSDMDLALVRIGEEVFAILDECSHARVPLSGGEIDDYGCTIGCYLHGAIFDLRSGRALNPPATRPVPVYPCKISGEQILVDIDNPITNEEN